MRFVSGMLLTLVLAITLAASGPVVHPAGGPTPQTAAVQAQNVIVVTLTVCAGRSSSAAPSGPCSARTPTSPIRRPP